MQKIARSLIMLLVLLLALFSLLLIIKPGASIFHIKQSLVSGEIEPYEGQAFYTNLSLETRYFIPEGLLLFEDDQQLKRTFTADVVERGLGSYSLIEQDNGSYRLIFAPNNNSNPATNGNRYTLLLRTRILNRSLGISILGILLLGISSFIYFIFKSPNRRESFLANPAAAGKFAGDFLNTAAARVFSPITNNRTIHQSRRKVWTLILLITIGASFFYILMEWIFFVTKPSFMDLMSWLEKIEILFVTSFLLMLLSLLIILVLAVLDYLISRVQYTHLPILASTFVPASVLAAISLILVDNFTYTIFNFGIVSSAGFTRFAYGFGFTLLFFYIYLRILGLLGLRGDASSSYKPSRSLNISLAVLVLVSALASFLMLLDGYPAQKSSPVGGLAEARPQRNDSPNIILIGSDGLSATHLSLYGYERETTPVLSELAKTSLLAENAFANSSNSEGSIVSILTGKPPAETRVLYPPNILQGEDAYQHLPGILLNHGYRTIEIAVPHYVDAAKANLMDGFLVVNGHETSAGQGSKFARALGFENVSYFIHLLSERIVDRLGHIFFINNMENPYTTVTQTADMKHDREQLEEVIGLIEETDDPFFLHVHLMGTHGPQFAPERQQFSTGQSQDGDWMVDFYDDSILNFDRYIGQLLEALKENSKFDSTILIIYSDHPMQFNVRQRIPLMFHFPHNEFAGRIKDNVQNLDIAPTILDYLQVEQPGWMEGQSLLKDGSKANNFIFSTGTSLLTRGDQQRWIIESARVEPPFYQFSFINLVSCHQWYWFNLTSKTWETGEVPGHSMPCASRESPTMEAVEEALMQYLSVHQFDISSLYSP
jgi:glucan phosphoethanolaminetransferase (alkaline phosphatase superfamily)